MLSVFFLIWTLIKWSEQYILDARYIFYISSHKKSLKQLHVIVCFSSAFTIYQHILLTNVYLEEISRKELYRVHVQTIVQKKLSTHRGRITFAWIWRLTGITFARSITIARKMYLILFFCICADYLLFRIYLIYS